MRDVIQLVGFIMTLQGVSGAIDHLAVQPFMSLLLNFDNRVVIPLVDVLADHARSQPSGTRGRPVRRRRPDPYRVVRSAAVVALAFVLALVVGAFQARHRGRG